MSKKSSQSGVLYALGGGIVLISTASMFAFSSGEKLQLSGGEFTEKYAKTENAVFLDVRTAEEFRAGHIASAVNIDYQSPEFLSQIKGLDPNKTYFIYCRSGNRSGKAISIMKSHGIEKIHELKGGLVSNTDLPLVAN